MYSTVDVKWHAYYFRETPNLEHMTYKQNIHFTLQSVFLTSRENHLHIVRKTNLPLPPPNIWNQDVHISC